MAIRRILVPTDFSASAERALALAVDLAAPRRAEIILVHAVELIPYAASPELYGPAPARVLRYFDEQERLAKAELAKTVKRLRGRGIGAHAVARTGTPYDVIVKAATSLRADLIVMGTQGRSGLSHLLIGSVAEKIVRLAPCPVVTVGPRRAAGQRPARRANRVAATAG